MSKTIWTEVQVEVTLEDFSDDELLKELEHRELAWYGAADLGAIYQMIKLGKKDAAYAATHEYLRNLFGAAL